MLTARKLPRQADSSIGDFSARAYGLPHFLKFVQTPDLLVMLNEYNGVYRQVFTDGRPLPQDPNPSWQGYSTATWSDDALVIETVGFRDDVWLDWAGSMITSAGKLRERILRPDFGHLEVTVDDPKAYTRPRHGADRRDLRRRRAVRPEAEIAASRRGSLSLLKTMARWPLTPAPARRLPGGAAPLTTAAPRTRR